MAMCIHACMHVVKMAVQSFHLVGQECRLVGHWPMAGSGKTTGCSICLWGPGGTSGAHTTVGVTVSAPVSTWPDSRRLSVMAQRSLLCKQGA